MWEVPSGPFCQAELRQEFQTGGQFFCTCLYSITGLDMSRNLTPKICWERFRDVSKMSVELPPSFCGLAALALMGRARLCDTDRLLRWAANRQMRQEGGFQVIYIMVSHRHPLVIVTLMANPLFLQSVFVSSDCFAWAQGCHCG